MVGQVQVVYPAIQAIQVYPALAVGQAKVVIVDQESAVGQDLVVKVVIAVSAALADIAANKAHLLILLAQFLILHLYHLALI